MNDAGSSAAASENSNADGQVASSATQKTQGPVLLAAALKTVAWMWTLCYIGRFEGVKLDTSILGYLLIACVPLSMMPLAKISSQPKQLIWLGLRAGFLVACINILIAGSLLKEVVEKEKLSATEAASVVLAYFILSPCLAALGAFIGKFLHKPQEYVNSLAQLAWAASVTTFLLVVLGGVVTSNEAGLAVPDWPSTYGDNMFLYSLLQMDGPIFYEHAHRLFGSLVGLSTILLVFAFFRTKSSRGAKSFAIFLLVFVGIQGILGALRVLDPGLEMDSGLRPEDSAMGLLLACVHGVMGQIFLACIVGFAAVISFRPATIELPKDHNSELSKVKIQNVSFIVAVVIQLVLGSIVRHFGGESGPHWIYPHMAFAFIVIFMGMKSSAINGGSGIPALRRPAMGIFAVLVFQLALGFVAWGLTMRDTKEAIDTPGQVFGATLHHGVGALLIGLAAVLLVRSFILSAWLRDRDSELASNSAV